MNHTDIKTMRKKQLLVTNVIMITVFLLYYIIINLIQITISTQYLILSILMLTQAIVSLVKGYSTTSIIPIYEQIAIYEKNKMGKEWEKQRKSVWICNFFLSGLFIFQFFINLHSNFIIELELLFFSGLLVLLLIGVNVSLLLHMKKVDSRTSEEFKGHTWKWIITSVILGIILAVILTAFTIFYLFSKYNVL